MTLNRRNLLKSAAALLPVPAFAQGTGPRVVVIGGGFAGASSCTGCHSAASGSGAMRALGGMPVAEIIARMAAFKSGSAQATIMDRIAKGFTEEEIRAIATWYAAQKP